MHVVALIGFFVTIGALLYVIRASRKTRQLYAEAEANWKSAEANWKAAGESWQRTADIYRDRDAES